MDLTFLVPLAIGFLSVSDSDSYIQQPRPRRGAELSDRNLKPLQILRKYGYVAENHQVVTEDGYVLSLHRIPKGPGCTSEPKGPVLLQHGILCSSVDWFLIGVERGLAYILADSCYDVWMSNSRGNRFSKAHLRLDTGSFAFWNFSFHEMGVRDSPAVVDYILEKTGHDDLLYVGHSQGTTQLLIFLSSKPEYNSKIREAYLLAPIAYLSHCKSPILQITARFAKAIAAASEKLGIKEFFPQNDVISKVGAAFCINAQPLTPKLCESALFLATGFDSKQLNDSLLSIILGHTPAGASAKQFLHFSQGIKSGTFREFDYGAQGNLRQYGKVTAPEYQINKITTPLKIFYSLNDWLASPIDVMKLDRKLTNERELILNRYPMFNHADYLYASDVVPLLYETLVEKMDQARKTNSSPPK